MRVLIVCSKNSGKIAPFISEQADALQTNGVEIEYFTIERKGVLGYLKERKRLMRKITEFNPVLIHAHFGLSGLLANLQRERPVITTYHGSDINVDKIFQFSKWAIKLSKHNIFVSQKNIDKAKANSKFSLIPCGVDTSVFAVKNKSECRKKLQLNVDKKYALFGGAFNNPVKNSDLAKEAVTRLENVELLELRGYTREDVAMLMNAVDVCLMTSLSEGSPQFIKEAMACNCPIVSVNVGDVREVIESVENCYLAKYDANDVAEKLKLALDKGERSNGREIIIKMGLDSKSIAEKILSIYKDIYKE